MTRHAHTPRLDVVDPRGLGVRHVAWCRIGENDPSQQRVSSRCLDVTGRSVAEWDPRLWANALPANVARIHSLSGLVLLEDSVDAGWRVHLGGADGQVIETTDSRGSHRRADFDESQRLMAVTETALDGQPVVVERYGYGDPSSASAQRNQCARLIRHDDPAGTWQCNEFSLAGRALMENRRFLQDSLLPDWPVDLSQRDQLLETGEGYTTATAFDATALPVSQTDAAGNQRTHRHTVNGLLQLSTLQTGASQSVQTLVSNIRYDAFDQIIEETLGNGVTCRNEYELTTSRLIRMTARKTDGATLQDLIYHYDPVGNIVSIEDKTQAVRHFNQRRIEPVSRYVYDSLYQLIEASGREVSTGASHGPELPSLQNLQPDPNNLSPYTQHYEYDAGGNLLQLRHVGAQPFTRTMLVAAGSNRSLPQDETEVDLEDGFDANGNLQALIRGQALRWDVRNQLRQVTTVQREESDDDDEVYVYDGAGQRCRKIRTARAATRTLTWEVRYLPGLEIRSEADGEILHVCTAQAGRSSVRLLHWAANKPEGIANDQLRYSLNDHLGSSAMELDDKGGRISEEGYYPYGGTAWWAARSAVEAKYKTVRYSGKERDASGLYYYGFRYYAPWLQRWLNPDPAGFVDGLNIYRFVSNSPISRYDSGGTNESKLSVDPKPYAMRWKSKESVRVSTLANGVIHVSIKGGPELFGRMGFALPRHTDRLRELHYVVLPNSFVGKVSGGDKLFNLSEADGVAIQEHAKSRAEAYINGSYFNMGGSANAHFTVGGNLIDNSNKGDVPIPTAYAGHYSQLTLSDGSYIHVAPKLTTAGTSQFTDAMSKLDMFRYGAETSGVGQLGHAGDPNPRSGISLAEDGTANTRLAIGLDKERGIIPKGTAPGFTLLEWATVMARLDNQNSRGHLATPAASSWNLDGGESSALGVMDASGNHLLRVNARKVVGRRISPGRPTSAFISYARRS